MRIPTNENQIKNYVLESSRETITKDLSTFGEPGHERIVIKRDKNNLYYPATASKPRGIMSIIDYFTRPKIVKIDNFLCTFFQQTDNSLIMNHLKKEETTGNITILNRKFKNLNNYVNQLKIHLD